MTKPPLRIYEGGTFVYDGPSSRVSLRDIVNGTIEDCAQTLVELRHMTWETNSKHVLTEAITAIRAKKEKP